MNKQELVTRLAEASEFTKKDSEIFLNVFQEVIMDAVTDGDKVSLVGFGSFEPVERNEKIGRNPKTGESVSIPARTVPKFKAGKEFKDRVSGKTE